MNSPTPGRFRHLFAYCRKERRLELQIAVIAVAVALWCAHLMAGWKPLDWSFYDVFLTIGTFVTALLVWMGELRQDWENTLPKRLNVCFLHPRPAGESRDYIAIVCVEAYLSGEGDIRQWSQTIAKQTAESTDGELIFLPKIDEHPGVVVGVPGTQPYKLYEVVFHLSKLPLVKGGTLEGQTAIWRCRECADPVRIEKLLFETERGRLKLPAPPCPPNAGVSTGPSLCP